MSNSSSPEQALRVLIVDDEELACRNLKRKVLAVGEAVVECLTDPAEAVSRLRLAPPDLLLLDIQMPGLTGFEVLAHFPERERPFAVVFCTAHDEHAIAAFQVAALDYLVKPVDPVRLSAALARVRRHSVTRKQDSSAAPSDLDRARAQGMTGWLQRVVTQFQGSLRVVSVLDVLVFSSEAHRTVAYARDEEHVLEASLAALESQLDPNQFLRCHRAHLVQLRCIAGVEGASLVLTEGLRVPLARRCRAAVLAKLSKSASR